MLRSVVAKTGQTDQASATAASRLQRTTPPDSATDLPTEVINDPKDVNDAEYTIAIDLPANVGPLEDTVDGMGVITFADEVASGYFGPHIRRHLFIRASLISTGPTSNSAFFSHISSAMREAGTPGLQQSTAREVGGADANYISRPASPRPLVHETLRSNSRADPVDVFVLPAETKIVYLVNLFFTDMGLLFPYIYKKSVFDGLADMKSTQCRGVRRSWLCLLNTILAFATCLTANPYERKEDCEAEADVFLQRALKLLPNIALKPANLEVCMYLSLPSVLEGRR